MKASVVITTRNRKDELRTAVRSALQQSAAPEVIVIDDGSTDGTAAMITTEFPGVRLMRHEESRGLIVRRNEGAKLATGDIIFSIDDDAAFSTPEVIAQTLREFGDERIGAVIRRDRIRRSTSGRQPRDARIARQTRNQRLRGRVDVTARA